MIHDLAVDGAGPTSNAFLVTGERTVLVDVGDGFDIAAGVRDRVDTIDAVFLTHTHPDHIGNLPRVTAGFGADVWGYDPDHDAVDRALADRDRVALGDHDYEVIHTPGHKNDHVCLYAPSNGVLFAGDLVFANGGFGRTDLPEGDRALLVDSIDRLLDRIGTVDRLYAGHGPSVTDSAREGIELALQAARAGR